MKARRSNKKKKQKNQGKQVKKALKKMRNESEFLTPVELSARYKGKINVRTLSNWRSRGEGPAWCKAGGRVLYSLEEVKAWEKKRTIGK